ncbi:MAG TPA: hypothetical protein VEX35_10875 [Allosphingosinicella sp.]|nr:hypothetical protein [Allosphingosinicella sp.]
MRIKIEGREIEGTPEEVAKLLELMSRASPASNTSSPVKAQGASPFVSEDVAYNVLTRRELAGVYAKMLQKLDQAGDAWTTAPELQDALGLTTREFAGILGAFGRRLSHTEGAGTRSFFDQYWDHGQGYNLYRLPPCVRAALRRAGIV